MSRLRNIAVVGPRALAHELKSEMPGVSPREIETDIRDTPDIYYSDYAALCERLKTKTMSEDAWRDLCRS